MHTICFCKNRFLPRNLRFLNRLKNDYPVQISMLIWQFSRFFSIFDRASFYAFSRCTDGHPDRQTKTFLFTITWSMHMQKMFALRKFFSSSRFGTRQPMAIPFGLDKARRLKRMVWQHCIRSLIFFFDKKFILPKKNCVHGFGKTAEAIFMKLNIKL